MKQVRSNASRCLSAVRRRAGSCRQEIHWPNRESSFSGELNSSGQSQSCSAPNRRFGRNRNRTKAEREMDYQNLPLTARQILLFAAEGMALDLVVAGLFYRSALVMVLLLPLVWYIPHRKRQTEGEHARARLASQFRDGALAVAAALGSGYSVENAWREAAGEMRRIYGEEGEITREFEVICRKLSVGQTSEEAAENLARRSGVAEIRQFAEVFSAAKRTSGQLAPILKDTAALLAQRQETEEEIRTMSAARLLEFRIMCLMPAAILLYMMIGNSGFTDPLYESVAGRGIMTVCLAVYAASIRMGEKILRIEI